MRPSRRHGLPAYVLQPTVEAVLREIAPGRGATIGPWWHWRRLASGATPTALSALGHTQGHCPGWPSAARLPGPAPNRHPCGT